MRELEGNLETLGDAVDAVPVKLTSTDVLNLLERRYSAGRWVFLREVRVATGFGATGFKYPHPLAFKGEKRIDAWALSCSMTDAWETQAFEVKVSRADLRLELADPIKREPAMHLSNRFYFVLAQGVRFDDLVIPDDCGILTVSARGVRTVRAAPRREVEPLPNCFLASALRRATGWTYNPPTP